MYATTLVPSGRALAEKMIKAHGGMPAWERASAIELAMHGGGLLTTMKGQRRTMSDVRLTIPTTGQRTVVAPYPRAGQRGIFDEGSVRIETDDGEVVERRDDPRPLFRTLRRQFRWDDLDLLYFAGYAMWNYISVPFVLLREGYDLEAKDDRTLVVSFPPSVQTHSRTQSFVLDEDGLLRRHLYTAEPVGPWARAVHVSAEHHDFDGLIFPTRRRVYPRVPGSTTPIPFPTLVRIDIDSVEANARVAA